MQNQNSVTTSPKLTDTEQKSKNNTRISRDECMLVIMMILSEATLYVHDLYKYLLEYGCKKQTIKNALKALENNFVIEIIKYNDQSIVKLKNSTTIIELS